MPRSQLMQRLRGVGDPSDSHFGKRRSGKAADDDTAAFEVMRYCSEMRFLEDLHREWIMAAMEPNAFQL